MSSLSNGFSSSTSCPLTCYLSDPFPITFSLNHSLNQYIYTVYIYTLSSLPILKNTNTFCLRVLAHVPSAWSTHLTDICSYTSFRSLSKCLLLQEASWHIPLKLQHTSFFLYCFIFHHLTNYILHLIF